MNPPPGSSPCHKTPLIEAAAAHHPAAVQILLEAGADPNISDYTNARTPLHAAVYSFISYGDSLKTTQQAMAEDVMIALIRSGADCTLKDDEGMTIKDLIIYSGVEHRFNGVMAEIEGAEIHQKTRPSYGARRGGRL